MAPRSVLMVAEKPSVAETIAQKLGASKGLRTRKALNGIPVHEWEGTFRGQSVLYKMTAVTGHVYGMDFPPTYNSWDKIDPADLFECPVLKNESNEKSRVPQMLGTESRGAEYLILFLDCDKEGENICYEVIGILEKSMKLIPGKTLFRAKFSALTSPDLKVAMDNLTVPNLNESLSVDARQELDLRIGCCFTRFQTKVFHGKYGSFDSTLVSYGPCQTPTLGFCVKRHDMIQQFVPEKFWSIKLSVKLDDGKEVQVDWNRGRLFDKQMADYFLNSIKEFKNAVVSDCRKKECTKKRPQGLNTVEMLRQASSRLGFSPHHTMQIAERLYTQGYISYPRTETTQYPANFDFRSLANQFARHDSWKDLVKVEEIVNPLKGHDAGDHSPITPLFPTSPGTFHDNDSTKLYSFVVQYFLATITADCVYLETSIEFRVGDESFGFKGKEIIKPGFTRAYPFTVISNSELIPEVRINANYGITEKRLHESETKPPEHLTESELISLMEKHGIGTDASIPVHINNICLRNYVTLLPGRKLAPTELGIILVHGYLKIDPELVLPTMRSAIEKQLDFIAKGEQKLKRVVDHTLDIFKAKFLYFVRNITGMDELFEASFSKSADSGKPFSRCGKCKRYMKLVSFNTSRLHCSICNETYNVPQNGALRAYNDLRCPLDEFELIEWNGGAKGKSFTFCPYCINNPPFEDMKKGNSCSNCSHPTCKYGFNRNGIAYCGECENGLLVLDPASGPKWKISCNESRCNVFFLVFEGSRHVRVLNEEECDSCSAQLVKADLPKKSEEGEKKGCIYCSDEFRPYIEKRLVESGRGGRRGGRGGGRGRGRGRGGRRGGGSRGRGRGGRDSR